LNCYNECEALASLSWSLEKNPKLESVLNDYPINHLKTIGRTIQELRQHGCINIQEKISDATALSKFTSVLSELEFALHLSQKGMRVTLLPDRAWGDTTPDIQADIKQRSCLVEVTRVGQPKTNGIISKRLNKLLTNTGYRVDCVLKKNIAFPTLNHEEREIQDKILEESLQSLEEQLSKYERENRLPNRLDSVGIEFELIKTKSGKGYLGVIRGPVIGVPTEALLKSIIRRVVQKAEMRKKFPPEYLSVPYLVALDCIEWSVDALDIEYGLYGTTLGWGKPEDESNRVLATINEAEWQNLLANAETRIPGWGRIQEARQRGWNDILVAHHLIPSDRIYVSDPGSFLKNAELNELSGLLFKENPPGDFHFFPNPFSTDDAGLWINEIFNSRI